MAEQMVAVRGLQGDVRACLWVAELPMVAGGGSLLRELRVGVGVIEFRCVQMEYYQTLIYVEWVRSSALLPVERREVEDDEGRPDGVG